MGDGKMLNIDLISDDEYFVELDIENIKPYYLISNYGRIYTKQRGGKLLTPFTDKDGYKRLELATYPKAKKYYVHRLVALTFVEGYFEGALVNHIDSIRDNNYYLNLEWVTSQENTDHGVKYGNILVNNTSEFRNLNTAHSIEVAEFICKLISEGLSNNEILEQYTFKTKRERKNFNTFINDLRGKRSFVWLSDKYF